MTAITLTPWDQLCFICLWAVTLLLAYLRGSIHEMDRHHAWLAERIAWLESLEAEAPDQPPASKSEAA